MRGSLDRVRDHDPRLAALVADEMHRAANDPNSNVLCVGTDGELTVTIVLVPDEMIGRETGPVLIPSAEPMHVIAVVSLEVVGRKADAYLALADTDLGQAKWDAMVNWFFDRAVELWHRGFRSAVPDLAPDD